MSLAAALPKPKAATRSKWDDDDDDDNVRSVPAAAVAGKVWPPPYRQRQGFIPRSQADYGVDGGAYPEIHVAQYPLEMGRKGGGGSSTTLALQTDEEGKLRYDLVLKQGGRDSKVIHSRLKDMTEKDIEAENKNARPSEKEINETTEKTRAAIEKLVDTRVKSTQAKNIQGGTLSAPTYIKYTPSNQNGQEVKSRIIRMMEAPIDPMEPPKFKHKKIARGPPSPPAPVLRSPPRKVTAEEQQNWVIPPCISNWKNAKGYTIPLDKRLAADGRGIQDIQINDNFAKLGEALAIADRHARDEVRVRAEMQAKLAAKEKKDKEEKLRLLAQRAREERAGIAPSAQTRVPGGGGEDVGVGAVGSDESDEDSDVDAAKVRERDELRKEKQRARERELRMSHMGAEAKAKASKLVDRDISEKIALGLAKPSVSKDSMFDQRLFNQSAGMSSGFGHDDSYNIYDKPLFTGSSANAIYRPKKTEADEGDDDGDVRGMDREQMNRLLKSAPHRGFAGTEGGQSHDGPVQFEKEDDDPFGLEQFMTTAKRGRGKDDSAPAGASHRGGGTMAAAGSDKRENYDTRHPDRKMMFEKASDDRGDTKRRRI